MREDHAQTTAVAEGLNTELGVMGMTLLKRGLSTGIVVLGN